MSNPKMYYFGPWSSAGHYLFDEHGSSAWREEKTLPWSPADFDARIQPHSAECKRRAGRSCSGSCVSQGKAVVHHKDGWTALCFWDSSVDKRGGCNSSYIAQGDFTFDEMVELAKTRFAMRWNKQLFQVTQLEEEPCQK